MGKIWRVSGPLVVAEGMKGSKVYEVVEVGEEGLIGEVIGLEGDQAVVQTHEETQGLKIGENVNPTGRILTVDLGPGLIGSIYDGLQKSLLTLIEKSGHFIKRGAKSEALSPSKKWDFEPVVKVGDTVTGGDVIGVVPETQLVEHKIMVPPDMGGVIKEIKKGAYTIEDMICRLENNGDKTDLTLM